MCRIFAIAVVLAATALAQTHQSTNSSPPDERSSAPAMRDNRSSGAEKATVEVLSNTEAFNLEPYLSKVLETVRANWYQLIPLEARSPELKQGKVAIELAILRDGNVKEIKISESSDNISMDYAAWKGVKASVPFAPLPAKFDRPSLALRMNFYYNPSQGVVPKLK